MESFKGIYADEEDQNGSQLSEFHLLAERQESPPGQQEKLDGGHESKVIERFRQAASQQLTLTPQCMAT